MPEASRTVQALTRRLLLEEDEDHPKPASVAEAAVLAAASLRARLSGLIGQTGYTSLVARAVRLAQADIPALASVTVDAEGDIGLQGIREVALAHGDAAATDGLTAILTHVIELLFTFVGENLTVQLVTDGRPELVVGRRRSACGSSIVQLVADGRPELVPDPVESEGQQV